MDIQAIKQHMKANNIKYQDLADMTGISISTIKKIFSGISQYPRVDTMQAIERALGLENEKTPSDIVLSEGESALLELFRTATDEQQEMVLQLLRLALSQK